MPDGLRILPNSFGQPIYWIFDSEGNPVTILDEYGSTVYMSQLITKFKYKYDEENDDECTFTVQVARVSQLNNPFFRYDTVIYVQWGYILPGGTLVKSPKRKVAIRDFDSDYKADGITLEVICTDLVSYLKNVKSNYASDKNNFEDWIKEILKGDYIATRTIKGKVKIIKKKPGPNDVTINTGQPDFTKVNITDYDFIKGGDLLIKGKSRSIWQEIKDRLKEDPNGPQTIKGRDNVLDIHKKNYDQAPFARYTYAGGAGEVIDFKPKSEVKKATEDEAEATYLNPDTKKIESTKIATAADHYDLPDGLTRLDVIRVFNEVKKIWEHNVMHPLDQIPIDEFTFKKSFKSLGNFSLATNPDGTTRVYTGPKYVNKFQNYSAKSILSLPYFDKLRREAVLNNYVQSKLERKFEARMKVIGDPSLVDSKIYDIQGVKDTDKGHWYATVVEHEMDPQNGYVCNIDLMKKPKRLATIIEKRDYPLNGEAESTKEYKQTDTRYDANDGDIKMSYNMNETDIQTRLAQQEVAENYYQNDSDIFFQSKDGVNNTPTESNSADV